MIYVRIKGNSLFTMKSFTSLLLLIFILTLPAYAYPENQMDDCIISAKDNPAVTNISEESIRNYCDCALTAIIDEQKDIRESGYDCAKKNFN